MRVCMLLRRHSQPPIISNRVGVFRAGQDVFNLCGIGHYSITGCGLIVAGQRLCLSQILWDALELLYGMLSWCQTDDFISRCADVSVIVSSCSSATHYVLSSVDVCLTGSSFEAGGKPRLIDHKRTPQEVCLWSVWQTVYNENIFKRSQRKTHWRERLYMWPMWEKFYN